MQIRQAGMSSPMEEKQLRAALLGSDRALEDIKETLGNEGFATFNASLDKVKSDLPSENELKFERYIFPLSIRNADQYDWNKHYETLDIYQSSVYSANRLSKAISLLSESNLQAAKHLANQMLSVAQRESDTDEAHNVLAYISLLEDNPEKAKEHLLEALDSEYTQGLVKNAFHVAQYLPVEDSADFIDKVIQRAPDIETQEQAFFWMFAETITNNREALEDDGEDSAEILAGLISPSAIEAAKNLVMDGCQLSTLQVLIRILDLRDPTFLTSDAIKQSKLYPTIEFRIALALNEGMDKLLSEIKTLKHRIGKSAWASERIIDHVRMLLGLSIETRNPMLSIAALTFNEEIRTEFQSSSKYCETQLVTMSIATTPSEGGLLQHSIYVDYVEAFTAVSNAFAEKKGLPTRSAVRRELGNVDVDELEYIGYEQLINNQRLVCGNTVSSLADAYNALTAQLPYPAYRNREIRGIIADMQKYIELLLTMPFPRDNQELHQSLIHLQRKLK